ncbi:MAG: hypothetical protein WCW44_03690 [archaeon]|jgi:hypothetical protein
MSLKDPSDDYDELIPEGNNPLAKIFNKNKLILFALVVGIALGLIIQYSVIDPMIAQSMGTTNKDCTYAKDLLNQENDCLYTLIQDPKLASEKCATQAYIEKNTIIAKDFNEEPAN